MFFKTGKLYKCPDYFLMIYPTKKEARPAVCRGTAAMSGPGVSVAVNWANYWSRELKCQVRYSMPGEIFMLLKRDGVFLHVLFGDIAGWIIHETWLDIKEAQNEV